MNILCPRCLLGPKRTWPDLGDTQGSQVSAGVQVDRYLSGDVLWSLLRMVERAAETTYAVGRTKEKQMALVKQTESLFLRGGRWGKKEMGTSDGPGIGLSG